MKLEYDIIETVQEKDLEFLDKEGKTIFVDAIRTDYIPTNFKGSPKNYVLREGHENWDSLHKKFIRQIHNEWLEELGYDTDWHSVHEDTKEIIKSSEYPVDDPIFDMKDEKDIVDEI